MTGMRTHLEELAHSNVVQAITAVEDHALLGEGFGQVLGGFSLASASRTSWGAPQVEVHGRHEGDVASVCEWCDHQPAVPVHGINWLLGIQNYDLSTVYGNTQECLGTSTRLLRFEEKSWIAVHVHDSLAALHVTWTWVGVHKDASTMRQCSLVMSCIVHVYGPVMLLPSPLAQQFFSQQKA